MADKNTSKFGIGFILGALSGVFAGMLMSPNSGEENRELLAQTAKEWKEAYDEGELDTKVKEVFGKVTDQGKEVYLSATHQLIDQLSMMKDNFSNIDQDKYFEVVADVINSVREEHALPQEELEELKKFLQKDYQKIMKKRPMKKNSRLLAAKERGENK